MQMRRAQWSFAVALFLVLGTAFGQMLFRPALSVARAPASGGHPATGSQEARPAELMPGLSHHHHPITTKNLEAQRFFDQGLTLVYGFNHEEAVRCFRRAAELDPHSPMPLWGIAMAVGPNYYMDVDLQREKTAYETILKALGLAAAASEGERGYVAALARRYSADPKADLKTLAVDYKNAMGELARRYPDDLDAATLYAESMMDLHPWQLWTSDGKAGEATPEIIRVLESVLRRDPEHAGANHYYIHALEASPYPERALPSARRLETLVPAAGHLVHMPSHIYMRTGNYDAAAKSNEAAVKADQYYLEATRTQDSFYGLMYYSHNLHFLAAALSMEGRFTDAKKAADDLVDNVEPYVREMPMLERFMPMPTLVLVRFHRWDEIVKSVEPNRKLMLANALWHAAQGQARSAMGDATRADLERATLASAIARAPVDVPFWFNNSASAILNLAAVALDARIANAKGDRKAAIDHWKKAVEMQDGLNYDEPPYWFCSARESLGGALLLDGQYEEAERVFRADLARNPRNGRSLFGLFESLKTQNRKADAEWVQQAFEAAWKNADVELRVEDL
jgi:tetratricopeptide (TPR) repeat protein